MGIRRIARTAAATLDHTFYVDETATDASGSVAVAITNAAGSSVTSGTGTHGTTGHYTFALAGQSALNRYAVAWTGTIGGSAVTETDYLEIAGGFYFGLAEGRGSDSSLSDTNKYTTAQLDTARREVEDECEQICDRAFVPRYRRAVLDGSGTSSILLTDADWAADGRSSGDVRTIRSASIAPQYGGTYTALTVGQLAACYVTADGNIWTEGIGNVIVEYEYGWDTPPSDLVRAAMTRFRTRLNIRNGSVPDRATSYTIVDGGTYRLDLPGAWKTGIPEVDAVYSRYSRRSGAGTGTDGGRPVAASRTFSYDVQRASLFHSKGV